MTNTIKTEEVVNWWTLRDPFPGSLKSPWETQKSVEGRSAIISAHSSSPRYIHTLSTLGRSQTVRSGLQERRHPQYRESLSS